MRSLPLLSWLTVLAACTTQERDTLPAPSAALSVAAVRTWYEATYKPALPANSAAAQSTTLPATTYALNWARAITLGGADPLVLVPLAGDAPRFAGRSVRGSRYLVVGQAPHAPALTGALVELLLQQSAAPVDTAALFASLYHGYRTGQPATGVAGTGTVVFYSADYHYATGRRFVDGVVQPGAVRLGFQARSAATAAPRAGVRVGGKVSSPTYVAPICMDLYQVMGDGSWLYVTSTGDCSNLPPPPSDGGGVYGGQGDGGWGGDGGGGGTGHGSESGAPSSTNVVLNISLAPCQTAVFTSLQSLDNGLLAYIVNKFSGATPGYNWRLYNGSLPPGINGETSAYDKNYKVVSTTFDASKFVNSNDLSMARTMLHESIHAYLVTYFANTPSYASVSYPDLLAAYAADASNNPNNPQHSVIANNWRIDLAWALEQYGLSKGYALSSQYYSDMAWGGLTTTSAFLALSYSDQARIKNLLSVEQSGIDLSGNTQIQKGGRVNCQ